MGLDCYVCCHNNESFAADVGYYRDYWSLYNWMFAVYKASGGKFCPDNGFNGVYVPLTKQMLLDLWKDVQYNYEEFSDGDYDKLLTDISTWLEMLDSGCVLSYYGSY